MKKNIRRFISDSFNFFLKKFNTIIVFRAGEAIGDQLCITGFIRKIYNKKIKIFVFTSYPEIFFNNPKIKKTITIDYSSFIHRILRFCKGARIIHFFPHYDEEGQMDYLRSLNKEMHLIDMLSITSDFPAHFGYEYANEIFFETKEVISFNARFKDLKPYALICPTPKKTFTYNKDWGHRNFQRVVDLNPNIKWLQTGSIEDCLLENVTDYRGKTSLREFFYLVKEANIVIANEGLHNHIASSFGTSSICLLSGFAQSSLFKYKNSYLIHNQKNCEFSPCWRQENCSFRDDLCFKGITSEHVSEKISEILSAI